MKKALLLLALPMVLATMGCSPTDVVPVEERVTADYSPAPHGGGDLGAYSSSRMNSLGSHMAHMGNLLGYYFMNANSDQPPYETWGTALSRDVTTIHRSFDRHLWLYEWNDPYVN